MIDPPRRSLPCSAMLLAAMALTAMPLAGCSDGASNYPSLAPRPIEQLSLAEPAGPTPAAPAVASPAAVARYAPMIAKARDADTTFGRALGEERGALARGRSAPQGSDAWAAAQVALSRLQSAREPVIRILADLDAARNAEPTQTNSGEAIAASEAFDTVQRIDAAEIDALAGASSGSR